MSNISDIVEMQFNIQEFEEHGGGYIFMYAYVVEDNRLSENHIFNERILVGSYQ